MSDSGSRFFGFVALKLHQAAGGMDDPEGMASVFLLVEDGVSLFLGLVVGLGLDGFINQFVSFLIIDGQMVHWESPLPIEMDCLHYSTEGDRRNKQKNGPPREGGRGRSLNAGSDQGGTAESDVIVPV
ncbi:hypothetical protein HMPREF9374_3678 [Desmospora sp. 8437]|nr:hypothetical protein HMPREF9374_3678 [Desmospora sp. 8437]